VKENYLESVQAHLLNLSSYRRFPDDDEFRRDFEYRDLYQFRRNKYYLRRLENFEHKERIQLDEYTIEHIMPQNENLSKEWRDELGPEWEDIQKRYLHTLGNLTLTRYNSEYSDNSFQVKRDMVGGFKASPVRLNGDLRELSNWTKDQIVKRAKRLSQVGTQVWFRPALSADILKSYQVAAKSKEIYKIENFKHLSVDSQMRSLFASLEREILAIDECVTEVPLKLYVAFKAETNFVDVIPKAKSLALTLNMNLDELVDPRKMAIDITGMGKWGNGNVRVDLKTEDELSYAIGLIRQSFELQMNSLDQ
jgi:predicted transport protein